jgi:hypothetical protein
MMKVKTGTDSSCVNKNIHMDVNIMFSAANTTETAKKAAKPPAIDTFAAVDLHQFTYQAI